MQLGDALQIQALSRKEVMEEEGLLVFSQASPESLKFKERLKSCTFDSVWHNRSGEDVIEFAILSSPSTQPLPNPSNHHHTYTHTRTPVSSA